MEYALPGFGGFGGFFWWSLIPEPFHHRDRIAADATLSRL